MTDIPVFSAPILPAPKHRRPMGGAALNVLREAGIGVALVLMIAFFAAMAPDFLSVQNLSNILTQVTINMMLATGMTFAILIGGIDLSVGAVMALCAVVAGTVLTMPSLSNAAAIGLAIAAALGTGVVCGAINGFISAFWGVPSFIVTLGMLNIARGGALEVTNARTIYDFPDAFNAFGTATIAHVPVMFLMALGLLVLGWVVLTRTVFGRMIYAIGNNEEAVRLSGHRPFVIKVAAFTVTGLLVGVAAVTYMARLTIANPILGNGFELNAIAAVIIGGTSLSGGRGSLVGTMLGAIIIGVLANGLILLGVTDFIRQIVTGVVIIAAVVLDAYRMRLMRRAGRV
ncbi:ribose ABC transporter permease [Neoasaia chiangmaiensis NBRC 101099]|nr:ABC transporter permease [Neoasaia chiangmaiensis]GBR41087.1 ribose ABC transporter permease [Neoasaia chiangmaiensis NBRC 101099]GEN13617.1 ribose ABC transporter permease [Neoasaia chiangmaiensis]